MIELVFSFFSNYLIEFMGGVLALGLLFRWISYRSSKKDDMYYSTFSRELEQNISDDKDKQHQLGDTKKYLSNILSRSTSRLPKRSLRNSNVPSQKTKPGNEIISLKDFVGGKHGLISSIESESNIFINKTQPNFTELADRIMKQDKHWTTLLGHIPIEGVSRMIDILPGLFIVLGVFGTFIGISMALPEIARIDFNNLEASGIILSNFVTSVTYAMKTSIAGIFFSLILTILNTLFPIKSRRYSTFKKVETSLQTLWGLSTYTLLL